MIMSLVGLGDIDSMAQNIVDCFACDGQRIIITSDDNPEKMYEYRVVGLFAVSD